MSSSAATQPVRDRSAPPTGDHWLPFHLPSIGEDEIAEVVDTLRSGWLTTGPKTRRLEHDFAALLGIDTCLAVSSGTAALHLALEVLGITEGDEVVVPTCTFTATAEAVLYTGARPVLADVDPRTRNLSAATLERALSPRTRAVMPVHVAGGPCDMDPILEVARAHGLAVIEDAAHALPARYRGRWVGTLGDAAAFSFYATKNVTTAEGGVLVTSDAAALTRARLLSLHGIDRDAWQRSGVGSPWRYSVLACGQKYNLSDLHSSLGIHQLRRLGQFRERRREIALRYAHGLQNLEALVLPREEAGTEHAWHLYMVSLRPGVLSLGRDAVIEELGQRGIGTSVHFIPLHLQPFYQEHFGYQPGDLPGAEMAFTGSISLPIYPALTNEDVDRVVDALADICLSSRR